MLAYRIVDWRSRYEVTDKNKPAKEDVSMDQLRKSPLPYVRHCDNGLLLSPRYRRMIRKAQELGVMFEMACYGLYMKLVDITRDQERQYRGWILDEQHRPLTPFEIADILGLRDTKYIKPMFDLLVEIRWIEWTHLPRELEPLHQSGGIGGKKGESGESGFPPVGWNLGEPFKEETEAEANTSLKINEKTPPDGWKAGDPVGSPPSDMDSAVVSAISDSVSVKASSADCRQGDTGASKQLALIKFTGIIHPRSNSDITTFRDIFNHLEHRMIMDTELDLFSLALEKAAQCSSHGKNPAGMFVAAMKAEPFNYVPKGISIIRGQRDKYRRKYESE